MKYYSYIHCSNSTTAEWPEAGCGCGGGGGGRERRTGHHCTYLMTFILTFLTLDSVYIYDIVVRYLYIQS